MVQLKDLDFNSLSQDKLAALLRASWSINCDFECREKLYKIQEQVKNLLECDECFLFTYNQPDEFLLSHQYQTFPKHLFNLNHSSTNTNSTVSSLLPPSVGDSLSIATNVSQFPYPIILSPSRQASCSSDITPFKQPFPPPMQSGTIMKESVSQPRLALPKDTISASPISKESLLPDHVSLGCVQEEERLHDIHSFPSDIPSRLRLGTSHSSHSYHHYHHYQCNPHIVRIRVNLTNTIPGQVVTSGKTVSHYSPQGILVTYLAGTDVRRSESNLLESIIHRSSKASISQQQRQFSPPGIIRNLSISDVTHKVQSSPYINTSQAQASSIKQDAELCEELQFRIYSALAVPILNGQGVAAVFQVCNKVKPINRPLGMKEVTNEQPFSPPLGPITVSNSCSDDTKHYIPFTSADEIILGYFASVVGETLRSTELLREAEVSRDRATGLLNLLQSLKQNLSIQSALLTLTTHAKHLVRAGECVVYAIERRNKDAPYLLALSSGSGREVKMALSPSNSILYNCATTGKAVVISDARDNREVIDMVHYMRQDSSTLLSPRLSLAGLPSTNSTSTVCPSPSSTPIPLGACSMGVFPLLGTKSAAKSSGCASDTDSDISNSRRVSGGRRHHHSPCCGAINNLAVVPIKAENQVTIGLIQLANKMDENGEILPFTDDDLQLLEMFGTLVGPRLERSEFGLRATGGRSVTEAGRANNPPAIERSRRPSLSTPSEPVIREESDDDIDDLVTVSGGSDMSPQSSTVCLELDQNTISLGTLVKIPSLERLSRINEQRL